MRKEINFYEKIIGNKDWVFKKRTIHNNSYYWTDQSELTIFVDQFRIQSLARGNKTISFNLRKIGIKLIKIGGWISLLQKGNFG